MMRIFSNVTTKFSIGIYIFLNSTPIFFDSYIPTFSDIGIAFLKATLETYYLNGATEDYLSTIRIKRQMIHRSSQ